MPATRISIAFALCLLGGCASVPAPLQGQFADIAPGNGGKTTEAIRWGGRVIDVVPGADQTCLEVLGMPLDDSARPRDVDADVGRFNACKSGFLDPAVFMSGREVTVTGKVDRVIERQIGDYTYAMPEVRVDTLFLWPVRPEFQNIHMDLDPMFGPYPWWPGPIIIYSRPHHREHR